MNIKDVFAKAENGTLTLEQFNEIAKAGDAKFTDLSEGKYVSKLKYDEDISTRDTQIGTLNDTVAERDGDLKKLQEQLSQAGTDETKLAELSTNLSTLQGKYDADTKALQEQLSKQAYSFAVKEYAAKQNFTSNAAKRDFVNSMISKGLQMEGDAILGADDFKNAYATDNADAFVVEDEPKPEPKPAEPKPHFVQPTGSSNPNPTPDNAFVSAFHFTGVRPQSTDTK